MIYHKKQAAIAVILSLIVLGGCQAEKTPVPNNMVFQLPGKGTTQTETQQKTETVQDAFKLSPSQMVQLSSELQTAIDSGDSKNCTKLADQKDQQSCESTLVTNKAVTVHDETICDSATLDTVKQNCHASFSNPFAMQHQ